MGIKYPDLEPGNEFWNHGKFFPVLATDHYIPLVSHHHHHQSHLTSWGRSTLQLQRSTAMSHATSAEIPVSISTCRTQVCLGRPGRRFQCRLLSGRPPARVSTASRIAVRPGASSGSQRTCP